MIQVPKFRSLSRFMAVLVLGILFVWGLERFYLPLLLSGLILSPFLGHWYCAWICPVNTFQRREGRPRKTRVPEWILRSWFIMLVVIFVSSLVLGLRIRLFMFLTLLGVFLAVCMPGLSWCRLLCPWMNAIRLVSSLGPVKSKRKRWPCHGCKTCFASCSQYQVKEP